MSNLRITFAMPAPLTMGMKLVGIQGPPGDGGGSASWGGITGTLSDQADLQAALDGKATSAQGDLADTALQPGASIPWTDVTGKPTFATVATSGAYADLSGKPTLAPIATSGSASDLSTGTVPAARLSLTVAELNTALSDGDVATGGGTATGTNTGDQTISLTGDVTGSGTGSFAATIANGAVTLAKMANLAASSIIGNNTGSAAAPIALTAAQVKAILAIATGDVSGLGSVATKNITIGTTAPSSPSVGDFWVDTN